MAFTVQDIIDEGRDDAYVDVGQVDNTVGLRFFNRVHQDVQNAIITRLDDNYFNSTQLFTLLTNTNTYFLPVGDSQINAQGFKKIKTVSLQYNTSSANWEYVKATPMNVSSLQAPITWYEKNQPAQFPTYRVINDNEIQIFPTPKQNSINGMRIEYVYEYADKLLTDSENTFHVPRQMVKAVYPMGIAMYIFQSRGLVQERQDKALQYEKELTKWLKYLADRDIGPVEQKLPNLRNLMY